MTKAQRAARDRLIAYAQQPDVYYPPTPEECHAAYELIQAMEKANAELLSDDQSTGTCRAILADKRMIANQKLAAIALLLDGGRLTRLEIAERINSHDRTMSRIMGRLVDLGLVDETRDGMTSAKSYRWIGEDK